MLYPGKELLLLTNWEEFFNKIISFKKQHIEQTKDEILSELTNYLEYGTKSAGRINILVS